MRSLINARMLTIGSTLTIFIMLGISSIALFLARRLDIPHTVLLVLIGTGLGFLSVFPYLSFVQEFKLTPELLFYLLLPTLIFESAYQMDIRKMVRDSKLILLLSVGSFLISTVLIAFGLQIALGWIDITVPISITLLFGALISATDPVAVLALFKEYGAPRRLSLIFEGESLFNDATAVALFLIVLEAIRVNDISILTTLEGIGSFIFMLIGGALFGLLMGGVFATLVGAARENEAASITLTIVLAHITFITAELISTASLGDFKLHLSPIIATTVASLLMGNYGRAKISPHAEEFVSKIWEEFAFMANSLIFLLIGVLIAQTAPLIPALIPSIILTIVIVAIARALSIYPVTIIFNQFSKPAEQLPRSWQHLLAWGSLRGALAVTMVLLIPDNLSVPLWNLSISPKEFLLVLTISCITATLVIKASTIKHFIRHFKIDCLTDIEEFEYQEAKALMHQKVTERLAQYGERGYIDEDTANELLKKHEQAFKRACNKIGEMSTEYRNNLAFRVLRMFAIGIERRYLRSLYDNHEVTESVFRRISGKLKLQLEAIEHGNLSPDTSLHVDARDIFERLASFIESIITPKKATYTFAERYMYFRAQTIISRKVLKELHVTHEANTIFTHAAVEHVKNLYTTFKQNSEQKLINLSNEYEPEAKMLALKLAQQSIHTIERTVLDDIAKKELITPKLYVALSEEIRNTN